MTRLSNKLRSVQDGGLAFWCPGCQQLHVVWVGAGRGPRWEWNGDVNKPTFGPSVKVTHRHPKGYSNEHPAPVGYKGEYVNDVCHFFVIAGEIQYCADSDHWLKGRNVELPDLPEELNV